MGKDKTKKNKKKSKARRTEQKERTVRLTRQEIAGEAASEAQTEPPAEIQVPVRKYVNRKHLLTHSMTAELQHGEQVSSLAYEVALEMGLPSEWSHDMIIAGFFHDIGKSILATKSPTDSTLVVEEMNSLRLHPLIGCEELEENGYSKWICDAVRWHHENKDGSGYPDGLKDGEIPLGACILRVCDVFCALIQDREYRKAFTPAQAISIMVDEVEKYDIRVFLAFQRVIHRDSDGAIEVPPVRPEVEEVWKELKNI